jgi:protein TonB
MRKTTPKKRWLKYLPAVIVAAVVILALVAALLLKDFFHIEEASQKKQIQQITVIAAPPPPPPPPKEEIKEPEVEEEIPEEPIEEAAPENDAEAPAGEDLGVDADGSAGGDGFGLVAKKGGRGLLGGSGYEQVVRQEINEAIISNDRLKRLEYVAVVTLRLGDDGSFEDVDVELTSGDAEAKALLEDVLRKKRGMSKPRPLEAASLVKLRVKSVL